MRAKGFLFLLVVSMAVTGACTKEQADGPLSPEEVALVRTLGFDESLALDLRRAGDGPLSQLTGINEEFES